jgi:hypothetical protein
VCSAKPNGSSDARITGAPTLLRPLLIAATFSSGEPGAVRRDAASRDGLADVRRISIEVFGSSSETRLIPLCAADLHPSCRLVKVNELTKYLNAAPTRILNVS